MHTNSIAAALVICLAWISGSLVACETPPESHTADSIELGADFVGHAPSGIRFPAALAGFQRGEQKTYDDAGENQSFAYNRANMFERVLLTVYVYPAPSMVSIGSPDDVVQSARRDQLNREFESATALLQRNNSGAVLLSDHEGELPFCGEDLYGRAARYRTPNGWDQPGLNLISRIDLCRNGRWWIKLRATYPEFSASAAEDRIAEWYADLDAANRVTTQ